MTYNKEYYLKNKEQIRKRQKEYNKKNKEQVRKRKKEYYEKNKEKFTKKHNEIKRKKHNKVLELSKKIRNFSQMKDTIQRIKETYYSNNLYMIPIKFHEHIVENFNQYTDYYEVQTLTELEKIIVDELYIRFILYLQKNLDDLHVLSVADSDVKSFESLTETKNKNSYYHKAYINKFFNIYNKFLNKQFPQKNYKV